MRAAAIQLNATDDTDRNLERADRLVRGITRGRRGAGLDHRRLEQRPGHEPQGVGAREQPLGHLGGDPVAQRVLDRARLEARRQTREH